MYSTIVLQSAPIKPNNKKPVSSRKMYSVLLLVIITSLP